MMMKSQKMRMTRMMFSDRKMTLGKVGKSMEKDPVDSMVKRSKVRIQGEEMPFAKMLMDQ